MNDLAQIKSPVNRAEFLAPQGLVLERRALAHRDWCGSAVIYRRAFF